MIVSSPTLSIVIPTYGRERVLVETLARVLELEPAAAHVAVVDQTHSHDADTEKTLRKLNAGGRIRHIRLSRPSIPRAMNVGLIEAGTDLALFLDDDVVPTRGLIAEHLNAFRVEKDNGLWCVVGQILQPWHEGPGSDPVIRNGFPSNSDRRRHIVDAMAGNLCVDRSKAIEIGGFDENFVGTAYRFESDFARRVIRAGGKILFEPRASVRHLCAATGGTRAYGDPFATCLPYHSVGKYYYGFCGGGAATVKTLLSDPIRAIMTRRHLRRPWRIPATLLAEFLGICWACRLRARGPKLVGNNHENHSS